MHRKSRKWLITGGTSGLGAALVEHVLAAGDEVVVLSRPSARLEQLAMRKHVWAYGLDLADHAVIPSLMERIWKDHPDIALLVNNAAVQYEPLFTDIDFSTTSIHEETCINFVAPATIIAASLSHMKAGGRIVNILSVLAMFPKRSSAVYSASKAALKALGESLRYQLECRPIVISDVYLPLVDTAMAQSRTDGKISPEQAALEVLRGIDAGKTNIYVGKARLVPALQAIAPGLLRRMMKRG